MPLKIETIFVHTNNILVYLYRQNFKTFIMMKHSLTDFEEEFSDITNLNIVKELLGLKVLLDY